MKIDTYLFGTIEVADDAILTFPDGLPAFEHCKRFALVHEQEAPQPPSSFTLQSIDDPAVAFQIADPTVYGFHYELALTDEESARLAVKAPDDVAVMLMLFRRDEKAGPIEANLRAPVLINTKTRLAMQKVIDRVRPNLTLSNLAAAV
jgi:flagellar assembly factor FliW